MKQPNFKLLSSPYRKIYEEAVVAGRDAEDQYIAKHGESMYCGFAWVEIPDGRSPFVRWCKGINLGSKHWKKGWYIWRPTDNNTQSMDVLEVGAKAFCEVLRKHGIEAQWMSRAD
jgi:hypothetical protein